jgi:tetratricopeptide (TPR) repeat protein
MSRMTSVTLASACLLIMGVASCGPRQTASPPPAADSFYVPAERPSSRYIIDARVDVAGGSVEGRETVSLRNTGRHPLGVVAFDWAVGSQSTLEVSVGELRLFPPAAASSDSWPRPIMVLLAEPLAPGASVDLTVAFGRRADGAQKQTSFLTSDLWYPRLWWDGLPGHDAYSVKIDVPPDVAVAASGRLDPKTGRYEAEAARTFGLYLAPGLKSASREVDGVLITAYFTDKGARAAAVCLETAADAIRFYKDWLGFYPFPFLNIIPGGTGRWGGYPVATGIVAIHGLETYVDGEPPLHWQHITSHEIGHEYWGEWVLEADDPAWAWIALGIFADTEYMTVRGFDPDRAAQWIGNYIDAVPMYYDTTLDAPPGREDAVRFDFNNTVVHSKGPAVIFALDDVLGRETFLRVTKRCLRDFGGQPFGWRDLRAVAESESGRSLAWFFDAWARSNQYLCYAVERDDSRADGKGGFTTGLRLKRLGTMAMPVAAEASFEDGTTQTVRADRMLAVTEIELKSRAPLRAVVLDPRKRLALVGSPVPPLSQTAAAALAFGWDPGSAQAVYAAVKGEPIANADIWYRLGVDLYGAGRPDEAADCFAKADRPDAAPTRRFGALGWLGLLDDLKGRRAEALAHYRAALAIAPDRPVRHDQFGITMNRTWVEERLKTPYAPGARLRVPDRPTAEDLVAIVDEMGWEKEGEIPLLVFRKAAGMTIAEGHFWFKLGLLLYDSGDKGESLTAFERTFALEKTGVTAFAALVWQGHMHDLLGNREAALACYKEALKIDPGTAMRHSQWGMTIDRAWVEARLVAPFVR